MSTIACFQSRSGTIQAPSPRSRTTRTTTTRLLPLRRGRHVGSQPRRFRRTGELHPRRKGIMPARRIIRGRVAQCYKPSQARENSQSRRRAACFVFPMPLGSCPTLGHPGFDQPRQSLGTSRDRGEELYPDLCPLPHWEFYPHKMGQGRICWALREATGHVPVRQQFAHIICFPEECSDGSVCECVSECVCVCVCV